MAIPTASVLDEFNRANEGPPPSSSWTANWANKSPSRGLKVVTNQMAGDVAGGDNSAWWNVGRFGPNCEAYAQLATEAGSGWYQGVAIKLQNPASASVTAYVFQAIDNGASTDQYLCSRWDSSTVVTNLGATGSQEWAAGDWIGLAQVGSTLYLLRRPTGASGVWTVMDTRTDSTFAGQSGFIGATIDTTTGRQDSFGGGQIVTPYITGVSALAAAAAGTSVTPTLPAHQAGDILVVAACFNVASTLSCSTSGWATIVAAESNANLSSGWFWKRATSAAETNPQVDSSATASSTQGLYAQAFVVRGCASSGTPFEDATANGSPTTSTTPATATITTTGPNRLMVALGVVDDDPLPSSGFPPTGWSSFMAAGSTTGGDGSIIGICERLETAGDVTGLTIATLPGADYWKTLALAFLPETTWPVDSPPSRRFQHMLIR